MLKFELIGHLKNYDSLSCHHRYYPALKITAGILAKNTERVYAYAGRTEAAPVKPESFTVYAVANGPHRIRPAWQTKRCLP
ncbi:MAG: hypothetical protein ACFNKE_04180 [Neisseria elongata]